MTNVKMHGSAHWPAERLESCKEGKGDFGRVSYKRPHLNDLTTLCQWTMSALVSFRFRSSPEWSSY